MNIKDLLKNPKIIGLTPVAFKTYILLWNKADSDGVIHDFTILGQVREWTENPKLSLLSSKNTFKRVLKELAEQGLVKANQDKKELYIK